MAGRTALAGRLCLVHDDIMSFLLESATEVAARIRLDPDKKTVARGALWYEEALPTETVLCGLAIANHVWRVNGKEREEWKPARLFGELETLAKGLVQLGGKSTVGRGSCLVRLAGGAA
jgi:CRISPR-associated protein Cmr4